MCVLRKVNSRIPTFYVISTKLISQDINKTKLFLCFLRKLSILSDFCHITANLSAYTLVTFIYINHVFNMYKLCNLNIL